MSVEDGSLSHLDILLQKTLPYKHHKQNYLWSIEEGLTPTGLKLQKKPALPLFIRWSMGTSKAVCRDKNKKATIFVYKLTL